MAQGYIPGSIALFMVWIDNFRSYVDSNAVALGLSTADVDIIDNAVDEADAAYALSSVAETRTPATVADTTTKVNYARTTLQTYAQIINNSANTTDFQRAALQITIRDTSKTDIPAPLTYPVITIVAATNLNMQLKYQDSDAILTNTKAKPFGAIAMELRQHSGATPPASPDDAKFVGLITRSPLYVSQDPASVGQTAYFYGRWVTARGLTGPWSAVAAMTIAGGGGA